MENTPENLDADAKKAKAVQTMRVIWMVVIAVFTVMTLVELYQSDWSHGYKGFRHVLSPFVVVLYAISALIRPRNKQLSYVLTGVAIILALTNLALMIIY